MTDFQLYLAIGVPILFNVLGFTLLSARINDQRDDTGTRINELRSEMRDRFDHMEKLFDAKLSRVEEVIDAPP